MQLGVHSKTSPGLESSGVSVPSCQKASWHAQINKMRLLPWGWYVLVANRVWDRYCIMTVVSCASYSATSCGKRLVLIIPFKGSQLYGFPRAVQECHYVAQ